MEAWAASSMTPSDLEQSLPPTTSDVFLGDRLTIRQPLKGYRAGVDAVLLAASVHPNGPQGATLLDIGAGVGTVGLCAAARLTQLSAVLLEREPVLAHLAQSNAQANGLTARVRAVTASVTSSAPELSSLGLEPDSFDCCVANPPFHDEEAGTAAGDALKAASHAMPSTGLEDWARFMARMVRPAGRATLIHKAEALTRILAVMAPRFGSLVVFPIFPRAGESAIRVIVEGIKGSRAPLEFRQGLVLHEDGHGFTPRATAILRHGAALEI